MRPPSIPAPDGFYGCTCCRHIKPVSAFPRTSAVPRGHSTLYDVYAGKTWIGATLAPNAEEAICQVVGVDEPESEFKAVRAFNTRICSDGTSVAP